MCFVGLCPNLKTRYQLSKKSDKKTLAIDKLQNEKENDSVSYHPPPKQMVAPSLYGREALQSRVSMLKDVMDALQDPDVSVIGVYGMGGVGKTTLAKEIHRKAEEEKLFDVVIMVAVNQSPEIKRIQKEIAEVLGLDLNEEGMLLRANKLCERLKRVNKILIILDDVWEQLKLDEVGIPYGNDCKGCKIFITSRKWDVCRGMGAEKNFGVAVLSDEEALTLLEKTVPDATDPNLHPIAVDIAKRCSGLPLLILVISSDLLKCSRSPSAWEDKLRRLSELDDDDLQSKVHNVLESSYHNLRNDELKSFFMLCGLFGQSNIQIRHLLQCSIGMGLFKHITSVEATRNRVDSLIGDLKAECLLLDGDMDNYVKMHDVVRDTAILIASREQHAFIGKNGFEVNEWPKEDCTRISLPHCNIEELPQELECPKAEIFLLLTEDLSFQVPDLFFKGMRKLKVVNMTGMRMVPLPSSLGFLANIHTLCLYQCQLDGIAIIGQLKQLEVLCLADSYIVKLPREMEQLTQLKILDLSSCTKLKFVPASVLSKLSRLQELYMSNSFTHWEPEGIKGNPSLAELECLSHLSTLEFKIPDSVVLPRLLFSKGLKRYKILIGDGWEWYGEFKTFKSLKLKLRRSIHLEYGITVLMREAEELHLDEVQGIENVLFNLDGEGFPQLKYLLVQNDPTIQHIIKSATCAPSPAFPNLEWLSLYKLSNLKNICEEQLPEGSLSKLRILRVESCKKLKNLFSYFTSTRLSQLQILEVNKSFAWRNDGEDNYEMEYIVAGESEDNNEMIEFNQLNSLVLNNLPNLRSFCNRKKQCGAEGRRDEFESDVTSLSLFDRKVSFPNLENLELYVINCRMIWEDQVSTTCSNLTTLIVAKCKKLEHLFTISLLRSLPQLKKLEVKGCESMEEIIVTKEGSMEEEEDRKNKIVFSELEVLTLWNLSKLNRFCSGCSIEFLSLKELNIGSCGQLISFVPCATGIEAAQVDSETSNSTEIDQTLFNKMVAFSNLEVMRLRNMDNLKYIWHSELTLGGSLSKLKEFTIGSCRQLLTIFASQKLELEYDEEIQAISVVFKQRDINIDKVPSSEDPERVFTFQNLQSIAISDCKNVKNIFPASVAQNLLKLEKFTVKNCGVEEIVARAERVQGHTTCFDFPQLVLVQLINLPELRTFYSGIHISQWPKLNCMVVYNCDRVIKFAHQKACERSQHGIPNPQPIFFVEKMSHNLKEVTFERRDLKLIESDRFPVEILSKLRVVEVIGLHDGGRIVLKKLKNLEKLVVKGGSIEVLFSDDGLAGEDQLVLVKHLVLYELGNLKHIWKWKQHSKLKPLFQYLETLEISTCYSLMNMASSSSSFQNLSTLKIRCCGGMTNLITASTAKTMVQLTKLEVFSCWHMTEIVASYRDDDDAEEAEIVFNKLRSLKLSDLPSLTSFCSGSDLSFNFPSLENVTLFNCPRMKIFCGGPLRTPKLRGMQNLNRSEWEGTLNATVTSLVEEWVVEECGFSSRAIPANVLHEYSFNNLRKIEVRDCVSVEQIFDLEGIAADDDGQLQLGLLPQLKELKLINLPMLTHLCSMNPQGILDLKNLTSLKIEKCGSLKYAFTQSMVLCVSSLQKIEVRSCRMMEGLIQADESVFHSLESVTHISICDCPSMKIQAFFSMFEEGNEKRQVKMFPNLKELSLDSKSIMILQSELAKQLSTIEAINLLSFPNKYQFFFIPRLINLTKVEVRDSSLKELFEIEIDFISMALAPSSANATFRNIKALNIYKCNGLISLASSSVAKNLVHLMELSVQHCDKLTEIVVGEQDGPMDEIVFTNLAKLKLVDLQSLLAFCLGNHNFTFTNLENVTLEKLPNLRVFCLGALTTPKLDVVILTSFGGLLPNRHHLDGNLNAIIEKLHSEMVGFKYIKDVKLSKFPLLKEKWQRIGMTKETCDLSFIKELKKLVVDECALFANAIPPTLLHFLDCLEVLVVEKCNLVEQVFDVDSLYADVCDAGLMTQLKELQLLDLPMLRHVWNKDPRGNLSFESLTLLKVHDCGKLANIFTLSMAFSLVKLQQLEVKRCTSVEHIITKEDDDELPNCDRTIFPKLNSLSLECLPSLSSFYSDIDVLKCPSLIKIGVVDCPNTELYAPTFSNEPVASMMFKRNEECFFKANIRIFSSKVEISALEELRVEWNILKNILEGKFQVEVLQGLKVIELTSFPGDSVLLPSHLIQNLPSLEKLVLSDGSSEKTVLHQLNVREPKHSVDGDCVPTSVPQTLKILEVLGCNRMNILAPSSTCFENLTTLEVSKCHGLTTLMTTSAARSLVQLKRMYIRECEVLQEIVAIEATDGIEDVIEFSELEYLGLDGLPCLKSFSSSNSAFNIPSLEGMIVRECPNMENFAKGVVTAPNLWQVQIGEHDYEWEWKGSLNNTIQALFHKMHAQQN